MSHSPIRARVFGQAALWQNKSCVSSDVRSDTDVASCGSISLEKMKSTVESKIIAVLGKS